MYTFIFSAIFIIILAEALVRFGLMGGGDGKILLGIGVLFYQLPTHLEFIIPYFPLSAFINGLLLSASVPLILFFYNMVTIRRIGSLKDIFMFFNGYARPGNEVRWYEAVIDTSNVKNFFVDANTIELGTTLETDEEVWVSPSIPFLIPFTAGFLFAYMGMDFFTIISSMWGTSCFVAILMALTRQRAPPSR